MATPKGQAAEQRKKFNPGAIDAEIALFDTEKSRFWYDPKTVLENLKAFAEVMGSTKVFRKDYKVWPHRIVSASTICQMFGS